MIKRIRVRNRKEVAAELHELHEEVKNETKRGIVDSEKQKLFNSIKMAIDQLKIDPISGIQIPKKYIPKRYITMADVNNLWKVDLFDGWRLIYTLHTDEIEILAIVLDAISHRTYEKYFGYKKR